jgi:putative YpdA family bacillithiol system oxidoreductase
MVSSGKVFDLVIVGAGPGGLSAALAAQQNQLNYILLEKADHLADTVFCYQKGKYVMAEPSVIPLRGQLWMQAGSREEILGRWEESTSSNKLNIVLNSPVTAITKSNGSFRVATERDSYEAARVVVAMGNQGNPRKLGAPGDDLPHVLPRLVDPDMYSDQDIVVVGGGDSAVEIALALADKNRVTLAVRAQEFSRVKPSLERQILERDRKKDLAIRFGATVEKVEPQAVTLKVGGATIRIPAGAIFVKVGAFPPRAFLEKCGVRFLTAEPGSPPRVHSNYETDVPGLYLIGAVSGRGDLIKHAINQGYEVVEHICGREVDPADEELLKKTLDFLPGKVSERIRALLPRAPLLATVKEEQIRELLLLSKFHRFEPGDVVFQQNDYSESLYMVLDGTVEVALRTPQAEVKTVAAVGAGEFFGEMSLISGNRRSATVRAKATSLLWEVNRKAMLKLIQMSPEVREAVNREFAIRAVQTYLLPELDHATLARLCEKARVLTVEKGKAILTEGEIGDAFYFLRSGKVKVSKKRGGGELVMAYLSAGQYFGEIALLRDEPRTASVIAVDRVEVIQVLKEDFLKILESAPELRARMEAELKRRSLMNIEVEMRPELAKLLKFVTETEVVVSDNVLLIDEDRCIHCDNCVKACESVHDDGQTRLKRTGLKFANILVANSCRHCENPLCMTDCPPGDAIVRDASGEVYIKDNCIACGNCAANCPYDNIFMVHPEEKASSWFDWLKEAAGLRKPKTPGALHAKPVKCDLCRDLDSGPACVHNCPTGAVLRLNADEYYKKIESLVMERKDALSV